MKIGVNLPQIEIGSDLGTIRSYVQAVEALGYDYLVAFDSIHSEHPWHEPLVLFGLLAGLTHRLELVTGVVVSPSRPTLLLAKQAATVNVLSGGRLRLGLGVGWNRNEYLAMGADFRGRGTHMEEQIAVLRRLWSEASITYEGDWHRFSEMYQRCHL